MIHLVYNKIMKTIFEIAEQVGTPVQAKIIDHQMVNQRKVVEKFFVSEIKRSEANAA